MAVSDFRPMTPEMLYKEIDALRQENERLRAQQKALIEAGQEMQNQIQDHGLLVFPDNALDRVVKEVRGE